MALGKDTTRVYKVGAGHLLAKELPSGDFVNLGYIKESKITENVETEKVYDERGKLVTNREFTEEIMYTGKLMQASAEEINFIRNSGGKEYQVRIACLREDTKWHLFEAAKAVVNRESLEIVLDGSARDIPIQFDFQYDDDQSQDWDHAEVDATSKPDLSDLLETDWPSDSWGA